MNSVWIEEIDPTPLGPIWIALSEHGLAAVEFASGHQEFEAVLRQRGVRSIQVDPGKTHPAARQIEEYLQGRRQSFELSIDWSAMPAFQQRVLRATCEIPYGKTSTYGELARQVGKPGAARAVGRAQATNPMPLVIPCHRVIGADGGLRGYGGRGGIATKAWLLEMEANHIGALPR